jgi:Ca2+:H+ antiporter
MAAATQTKQSKTGIRLQWWHVLLLAVPAAIVVWYLNSFGATAGQYTVAVFALAAVSLVPLATMIGDATERVAEYVGDLVGGLLNATFSNVPELAIGIFLLLHAHLHAGDAVVVDSDHSIIRGLIIGSVINNVLLVLGASVFVAALRHGRMKFKKEEAAGYASMLALAVVGLSLPTLASAFVDKQGDELLRTVEPVSLLVGIVLVISYVAYIGVTVFHWRDTPAADGEGETGEGETGEGEERDTRPHERSEPAPRPALRVALAEAAAEDVPAPDRLGLPIAFVTFGVLTVATVLIAFILVDSTDHVIAETPLTSLSVGLIIFPILCNIGEFAGVVSGALRKDMELAMSIAGSSAVQVPLLVAPLLIFVAYGWYALTGGDLNQLLPFIFQPFELIVVGLVTFVYALVSLDGETTWLEGLQLVAFYSLIAVTALALPGR